MGSLQWASDALTKAADEWSEGKSFDDNPDAKSILKTVESVYAIVGDDHEEMGRTCTAIGMALSGWRNGSRDAKKIAALREMASCFAEARVVVDESEAYW